MFGFDLNFSKDFLFFIFTITNRDYTNNSFFEKLHPFYPFIPESMHTPEALSSMPILLTVILTIASRYCKVSQKGTKYYISSSRRSQIHHKLWEYCQQLVSRTVWGEASTRSIGTVFSFLLLSEWNPRAIHWRFNDYANSPLGTNSEATTPQGTSNGKESMDSQSQKPMLAPGDTAFSATARSDRMSWLFIGSATRLAQDLGIFDTNTKVYLATHMSEIILALRLGRRSMLATSLNEEIPELAFTRYEQATLGLLRIMSLAHETLNVSKKTTKDLLRGNRFLAFLNLFPPHITNWMETYKDLIEEGSLESESLLLDYNYTRLFIYSFALSNKSMVSSDQMIIIDGLSTQFIGMATDAALKMLAVALRVYDMGYLKAAPIRWVVRIVHAAVFLVKAVWLTPPASMFFHKDTVNTIKKTAIALKDSSPDELHLANKYSSILLHICNDITIKSNNFAPPTIANLTGTASPEMSVGGDVSLNSGNFNSPSRGGSHELDNNMSTSTSFNNNNNLGDNNTFNIPGISTRQSNSQSPKGQKSKKRNQFSDILNNEEDLVDDDNLHIPAATATTATSVPQERFDKQDAANAINSVEVSNSIPNSTGFKQSFGPVTNSNSNSNNNNLDNLNNFNSFNSDSAFFGANPTYFQYGMASTPINTVGMGNNNNNNSNNEINSIPNDLVNASNSINNIINNSGNFLFNNNSNNICDITFDFLTDGYEGLGFVDQLMDGIETQLGNQQRQKQQLLNQQRRSEN